MTPRHCPPVLLALLAACPPPPDLATCDAQETCTTTGSDTTGSGSIPTTSDGDGGETGDSTDASAGSTAPDAQTDVGGTTEQPARPPQIVDQVVMPDHVEVNGVLAVTVTTEQADGVRMAIDGGAAIELALEHRDEFVGQITAFTGLDNGKHTATFTPWRDSLIGESVTAEYEIALPPPGHEVLWKVDGFEEDVGHTVAIATLPDGRPVELRTYQAKGEPRCLLIQRSRDGGWEASMPVLPNVYCKAIDLAIDRESGVMHLLVERMSDIGPRWWALEYGGWDAAMKKLTSGEDGDEALALAVRPGLVAVCGAKRVKTPDKRDAMAVLLRPDQPAKERLFDYEPKGVLEVHTFRETIRDCTFVGDTLVLVGEAHGRHDLQMAELRDRLMMIEFNTATSEQIWTIDDGGPAFQSRGLAVTVDDESRYQLAGYTCLDDCVPEGELRVYAPRGELVSHVTFPLGSAWLGPHDIAWSPAGYAVVALGEPLGDSFVFKVQAFAPGVPDPLWTFLPGDKEGPQFALAVAVGPFGEVYAGGIAAMDNPVFAVIGG